jgi:3-oxoadipate enol-lactonase
MNEVHSPLDEGDTIMIKVIRTVLGDINIEVRETGDDIPIVFLHGVFLDGHLWDSYLNEFTNHPRIIIDMPAHGQNHNVGRDWSLDECVTMLLTILDELNIAKAVLIGQSWGSMVALRAANHVPERFAGLLLCNMPLNRLHGLQRIRFLIQRPLLTFRSFYAKQAARSLYSQTTLVQHPEFITSMQSSLAARPGQEIWRTIKAVILDAEDSSHLVENLRVPALALKGREDYVPTPPKIETWEVPGGHISPHEASQQVHQAISKVLTFAA